MTPILPVETSLLIMSILYFVTFVLFFIASFAESPTTKRRLRLIALWALLIVLILAGDILLSYQSGWRP